MGQSAYGRALQLRVQQTAGGLSNGDHDVDRCFSDAMDSGYSRKGVKYMAKYTYTYFMRPIETNLGFSGVEFWFPDWGDSFPPYSIFSTNDKEIMLRIRHILLNRCKFFETMGINLPTAKNYSLAKLQLNTAMQAITIDTESE